MKLVIEAQAPGKKTDATLIRFIAREERAKLLPEVPEAEFSGKPNALLHLRHEGVLYVGIGARAKASATILRSAAGAATLALKKIGRSRLALNLADQPAMIGAIVEGIVLADYRFDRFASKQNETLESVRIQVGAEDLAPAKRAAERARVIAESTNLAREIGNLPGNVLFPESLADRAVQLAREHGLKVTVLAEPQLQAKGFGGILAVGQGSARGPRFIILEHRGGPKTQAPIALVGKAITFDTGGISIKPAGNMEEMVFDKCGGMAVLGAMAAIARLGVKRNVVGLIASAENMPGGNAYRPGDIVTTYDGKHIEIINTDAEGRVVLADAIAYARRDCRASAIVDLATLTGACVVALGEYAAGLFSSDDQLQQRLLAAAETTGERLWPLPIFPEHEDQIKSDVALIKNTGGRYGGASTAAAFLKTFAEETPWAHLDIAPVASGEKDRADLARGATGFGVRTLVELVERWE
ncbi:MAG TPA: leucyl aminopeptidase [Chthoniobacteraceae bacterium]